MQTKLNTENNMYGVVIAVVAGMTSSYSMLYYSIIY